MTDENIIDQIKDIFLKDDQFKTKFAFLSDNSSQVKIIAESLQKESQETLIECFLIMADILSKQALKHELRCAVEHVKSLFEVSNDEVLH
jgi:hypothetical protein